MSQIYQYIPLEKILTVDNYKQEETVHKFTEVKFRIQKCNNFLNFHSPLGIYKDKVLSVTNKQLSFLTEVYHHFVGDELATEIKNTYDNLQHPTCQIIKEPVFQFVDYESVNGTGHSYDLMFHLLYIYTKFNIKAKLLVVKSDNHYYNVLLKLIQNNYDVEYFYLDLDTNYLFEEFYCARTYQNILFTHVKEFINNTLIQNIMIKFDGKYYYDSLCKLKYKNINNIARVDTSFVKTELFTRFLEENSIYDLNDNNDEELKIYLLNKSNNIIVSSTSPYYINICYYIKDISSKNINIIYHASEDHYLWKFTINEDVIKQNMPSCYCGNIIDQEYNKNMFKGRLIKGVTTLEEIIPQVSLKY
jgi:hypothetical protein